MTRPALPGDEWGWCSSFRRSGIKVSLSINHPIKVDLHKKGEKHEKCAQLFDRLIPRVRAVLKEHPRLEKPLAELLKVAAPAVAFSPLLRCKASEDEAHRKRFAELVSRRFISSHLVNHAFKENEKHDVYKAFAKKPLSRKYMKL